MAQPCAPKPVVRSMTQRSQHAPVPFFIVGSGRSGTSLLHSILASHSQVAMPPETQFMSNALRQAAGATRGDRVIDLPAFLEVLRTNVYTRSFTEDGDLAELDTGRQWGVGEVLDTLLLRYAQTKGKSRWGEKTPHHLWYWRGLDRLFPCCKFVIVVRDGRDVALSLCKVPWASDSIYVNAYRWMMEQRIARRIRKSLGGARAYCVQYEKLVQDPGKTLAPLCSFLDLEFEPSMLDDAATQGEVVHALEQGWKSRNLEKVFTTSVGRYRRELSPRTVSRLNGLLRVALAESGPYGLEVAPPHAHERAAVRAYAMTRFYASFGARFVHRRLFGAARPVGAEAEA
jgi:hypothetical protein